MNRVYPEAPIPAVAGLLTDGNGKLLLVLRRNPPAAGTWSLPGGKQELGETLEEALRREIREETGLEIGAPELITTQDMIVRDADQRVQYHYVISYYRAPVTGGKLAPGDDVADVRWYTLSQMLTLDLSRRLLRLARAALQESAPSAADTPPTEPWTS